MLCIRPRARAWSKSGEFDTVVVSKSSMDMICTLVSKLRLERFPTIIVGTPSRNDWRYHFGQFLFWSHERERKAVRMTVTELVLSELLGL
jgi:hypothetical protein